MEKAETRPHAKNAQRRLNLNPKSAQRCTPETQLARVVELLIGKSLAEMFAVPRRTKLIWAQIKSNEDVQLRGDPLLTCFSKLGLSALGCIKAEFHELGIILEANDKICNIISTVFQVLSFFNICGPFLPPPAHLCEISHDATNV